MPHDDSINHDEQFNRDYIEEVRSGQIHPSGALRQLLDEMDTIERSLDRCVGVFDALGFTSGATSAEMMKSHLPELRKQRSKALYIAKGVPRGEKMPA